MVTGVFAFAMASSASAADPPASASWHGRPIQAPRNDGDVVDLMASFPRGWSAGPVRVGTGFHRPGGSARVREVQRRLWRLGYRPGPVDGMFGPTTRAAVEWFQIKHGYEPDGVVNLRTLTLLRERSSAGGRARDTSTEFAARTGQAGPAHDVPTVLIAAVLLLVPLVILMIDLLPTKAPKPRRARPARTTSAAPQPLAIGYVRNRNRAALARDARTIRHACATRGWKLAELVRDDRAGANGTLHRPALAAAMARAKRSGEVRLVVSELAQLSRSTEELTSLFEWFAANGVQVVVADPRLDTTSLNGNASKLNGGRRRSGPLEGVPASR
jgi:peptidoglycan hydrolase-like protein with peptidoglycan-binding domain